MRYRVEENWCKCHPETCCCRDWAIVDTDGKKHSTHSDKTIASQFTRLLNETKEKYK